MRGVASSKAAHQHRLPIGKTMSNQQNILEQDAMNHTERMDNHEPINHQDVDDQDGMPEQEKLESIEFLRGRSQRSIDQWFEMAEHLAQKLDADTPKKDFTDICREGAGIDYVTGTVWARIARSERVQTCRSKILTTAWTTFRPIPRLSDDEYYTWFHENLADSDEPTPMTEKQIRAYRRAVKQRRPQKKRTKNGKSPFIDRLDFYSRMAQLMSRLGDDRMMKSNPRYRQHLDRVGGAETLVSRYLDQITEPLMALLTRSNNHGHLTMADGRQIHDNDLERDLHLVSTPASAPLDQGVGSR
jgi:hypothetical protein